ncbi:MAG: hypothetical protein A3G23_02375 [Bacteroidetes bacterium RIFCSPLOWO2_12_FULL_37_12]|nr:MAG: hypothetical protein A3G23_02375 [Bacteroidetes bacterium RIFCSPLOWO2_12_FULL_37_12]
MEKNLNFKRILLGGLAGGVAMFVVGMIIHGGILEESYNNLMSSHVLKTHEEVNMTAMWLHHIFLLVSGILCTALYAIARTHLGAGAKTAIITGLLVGLIASGTPIAMYVFYNVGAKVPFFTMLDVILEITLGTLVGGWIYKEQTA